MNVEFHPEAVLEMVEAGLYYETQVPGLGRRFEIEVQSAVERILQFPKIGHPLEADLRKWGLDRFPYSLIYEQSEDMIYILVVANQHRRPGYWKPRHVR